MIFFSYATQGIPKIEVTLGALPVASSHSLSLALFLFFLGGSSPLKCKALVQISEGRSAKFRAKQAKFADAFANASEYKCQSECECECEYANECENVCVSVTANCFDLSLVGRGQHVTALLHATQSKASFATFALIRYPINAHTQRYTRLVVASIENKFRLCLSGLLYRV